MLKSLVIVCFLAAAAAEALDCYENGIDYSGTNVNNGLEQHSDSTAECQVLCQMTNGCLHFSWVDATFPDPSYRSTCWLRSDVTERKNNPHVNSGPRMCSPDLHCPDVNTNTQGRIEQTKVYNIPSWEECAVNCKNSDSCNFWTWHQKDAGPWAYQCVLMKDFSNTASDTNTISGDKNCGDGTTSAPGPTPSRDCHDYVYVGGPNFEFWNEMGYMKKQAGKSSYKQIQGEHILQYKAGQGWVVTVSEDGDVLAYTEDPARCAYEATSTWWYLDHGEWLADIDLGVRVSPEEECSQDDDCGGCMWIGWNGHTWCCSSECTWGWIDLPGGGCVCGH